MKRTFLASSFIIASLVFTLIIFRYNTSVYADSRVIYVDYTGQGDYLRIQDAINNATTGDIIFVRSGTYIENVVVDKSVSLIGENRDSTFIDAGGTGTVIRVTANKVNIESFTIRNSGTIPTDYGINLALSNDNIIKNNKITGNYMGIWLFSSINNTISRNNISSNLFSGVHGLYSLNNIFLGNIISSNDEYGVYLGGSNNNTIHHNNFVENNVNAFADSLSSNLWDYRQEGNYWSNYNGTDFYSGPSQNISGSDGVGDIAFAITEYIWDNYPLMGGFSGFSVTMKGEENNINVISNSSISDFKFEIGAETGSKIIRFRASGDMTTVGFCRVSIPARLMDDPYLVLVANEEVNPTLLNISSEIDVLLYFTYGHDSQVITITSPEILRLYNQLLSNYSVLQTNLKDLNSTYHEILNDFIDLLVNNTQLQGRLDELNSSYQEHLVRYAENAYNLRNLMYIFAATTAIFLATTVYLSKYAHRDETTMTKVVREEKSVSF
ncbi:MAG: right-handed parallel beta-helix repeat-containing protein [Candidatus Bathyarchaeota archaeon]|nr:MAG: right-handed parallel beta-helix repeat-containing protein [Candidatus Bathyarchaeota archaeon]